MILASAADVVYFFLLGQGLIQTNQALSWWATIGKKTSSPASAVFIYDTTGVKDGRVRDGFVLHPGVQFIVRGATYPAGKQRLSAIIEALHNAKYAPVTVGSGPSAENLTLCAFSLTSDIAHLGQETDGVRELFSANGTVTLQKP